MVKIITVHCNPHIDKVLSHYYIQKDGLIKVGEYEYESGISICIEAENELKQVQYNALQDLLDRLTLQHPQAKIGSLQTPFNVATWYKNISSSDNGIFDKMLADENKFNPRW